MIPGGYQNSATNYSFAAGHRARAHHTGTFVWADAQPSPFASTGTNQFLIRALGGVGINNASPLTELDVRSSSSGSAGQVLAANYNADTWVMLWSGFGAGTNAPAIIWSDGTAGDALRFISGEKDGTSSTEWMRINGTNGFVGIGTTNPTNRLHVAGGITCTALTQTSDRNAKENFAPVSPQEVLNKVAALPITTWNFKEMKDGRHMGPMAQDFYVAFGLGGGDTTITSMDPDGVALAAIQGLNQKLEARLEQKETEIAELRLRLEKLERMFDKTSIGGGK
jgi:hypothetical protein